MSGGSGFDGAREVEGLGWGLLLARLRVLWKQNGTKCNHIHYNGPLLLQLMDADLCVRIRMEYDEQVSNTRHPRPSPPPAPPSTPTRHGFRFSQQVHAHRHRQVLRRHPVRFLPLRDPDQVPHQVPEQVAGGGTEILHQGHVPTLLAARLLFASPIPLVPFERACDWVEACRHKVRVQPVGEKGFVLLQDLLVEGAS